MTGAREEILDRIRRAQAGDDIVVPRDYRGAGGTALPTGHTDPVELFAQRVAEYRAEVRRCDATEVGATVADVLRAAGHTTVLAAPGVPAAYLEGTGVVALPDGGAPTTAELDAVDGVITTCAVAIALTGTVVLDHHDGQGRRALTLVPDFHLVVVRSDQVVLGVPDAIALVDPVRPQTWISGPSATSDIELNRVEGVHGPRQLVVVIVS